jgi:hypothetical protein
MARPHTELLVQTLHYNLCYRECIVQGLTPLTPKPVIAQDSDLVSSTTHPYNSSCEVRLKKGYKKNCLTMAVTWIPAPRNAEPTSVVIVHMFSMSESDWIFLPVISNSLVLHESNCTSCMPNKYVFLHKL